MTRAPVRALSGDVTAAASAGVYRRRMAGFMLVLRATVVEAGQTTRTVVAVGAVMDTAPACPA